MSFPTDRIVPRYDAPGPYPPAPYPTGEEFAVPARRVESRHVADVPRSFAAWLPEHVRVLRQAVDEHVRPAPAGVLVHLLLCAQLVVVEALARQLAALAAREG